MKYDKLSNLSHDIGKKYIPVLISLTLLLFLRLGLCSSSLSRNVIRQGIAGGKSKLKYICNTQKACIMLLVIWIRKDQFLEQASIRVKSYPFLLI